MKKNHPFEKAYTFIHMCSIAYIHSDMYKSTLTWKKDLENRKSRIDIT